MVKRKRFSALVISSTVCFIFSEKDNADDASESWLTTFSKAAGAVTAAGIQVAGLGLAAGLRAAGGGGGAAAVAAAGAAGKEPTRRNGNVEEHVKPPDFICT